MTVRIAVESLRLILVTGVQDKIIPDCAMQEGTIPIGEGKGSRKVCVAVLMSELTRVGDGADVRLLCKEG